MRLFLVIFAVEALAASWIEISKESSLVHMERVEALAASWIEITAAVNAANQASTSKPLRLRGLKS